MHDYYYYIHLTDTYAYSQNYTHQTPVRVSINGSNQTTIEEKKK